MYQVVLQKRARKFMERLPKREMARLLSAIEQLPHSGDIKPLQGWAGVFRLRVGDYRVIYTVDSGKLIVCVVDAGSRGQIYNRY